MIQEHYGKHIRDDGDALLRAYVERPKEEAIEEKPETFSEESAKYRETIMVPTGLEPVLPT